LLLNEQRIGALLLHEKVSGRDLLDRQLLVQHGVRAAA
jgi:hypothetical protein